MEDRQSPGFAGVVYRQSLPRYAEITDHTLIASCRAGGRFNGANEFGALYVSLDPETPLRELHRAAARMGITTSALLPRTLFAAEARLARVLDLTAAPTRDRWKLSAGQLLSEDWSACQEVARRARRGGYEAIRFPSATGEGENLAIFVDRMGAHSFIRILREEEIRPIRP